MRGRPGGSSWWGRDWRGDDRPDLREAGWEVVVLEARDRVGGRVFTLRHAFSDGLHAEGGGESIDDNHHDLLAMLRRFDLRTELRAADRDLTGVAYRQGRRTGIADFVAQRGGRVLDDYEGFDVVLARTAEGVEVQRQLDEVYPEGRALRSDRAATTAWRAEPFTGGGYGVHAPGQMVPYWPALREPTGRIHFAGEHTESLAGYMESAIRSGHRVAERIGPVPS